MILSEHERAKRWRERHGLSLAQLADLTGYSELSIRWFEKGQRPPNRGKNRDVAPWVWRRYKMACGCVAAQIASRREFDW